MAIRTPPPQLSRLVVMGRGKEKRGGGGGELFRIHPLGSNMLTLEKNKNPLARKNNIPAVKGLKKVFI